MTEILQELSFDYEAVVKRVYIDYCIRSDDFDLTAITTELGIQPSRAWSKDEKYLSRVYDPKTKSVTKDQRARPWSIWAIETKSLMTKNVEEHFIHLFNLLEPKIDVIKRYLDDEMKYSIRLYIWWEPFDGHGSYALSKKIIERAITLCHYIEFGFISKTSSG